MIHRKVFEVYTKEFLYSLMIISTTSLLVSYAIYVVQTGFVYLPLSLPVFIFVVLRYYMLVLTTYKGRHPHELIFFDKQILIAGILFMVILSVSLYI